MTDTCPKCGVDLTQSSGVVCPECGFVLKPDADSPPLLPERKGGNPELARLLSFVIPAGLIAFWGLISGTGLRAAVTSGAVMGGFFFLAWLLAGRVATHPVGQILMSLLFFFGGIAVVVGVLVGGCIFLMR